MRRSVLVKVTSSSPNAVVGNTTWDMTLDWCNVEVNGVGKVGIGWFSKSFNKNIWRLQNPQTKINLLNRDQAVLVLE